MTGSILLVEDDADDALLVKEAFAAVGVGDAVRHVKDGEAAVEYLKHEGEFSDPLQFPTPTLVLLDLRLPKMTGLEILKWMREQAEFKTTVVVVIAGLPLDSEIQRAYLLGANSLLVKGTSQDNLDKKIRLIKAYWLEANESAKP
ncbi:MAG: hypothetical protein QOF48_2346 [Verrucomicrobiota bacterium]|jgi:CheY-like chemotaxis protein